MTRLPEAAEAELAAIKSTYRTEWRQGLCVAHIVDLATDKSYAKASAPTEEDAVLAALKTAKVSDKPMSIPETLAHQRAEIDRLKAKLVAAEIEPDDPPPAAAATATLSKPRNRRLGAKAKSDDVDAIDADDPNN